MHQYKTRVVHISSVCAPVSLTSRSFTCFDRCFRSSSISVSCCVALHSNKNSTTIKKHESTLDMTCCDVTDTSCCCLSVSLCRFSMSCISSMALFSLFKPSIVFFALSSLNESNAVINELTVVTSERLTY